MFDLKTCFQEIICVTSSFIACSLAQKSLQRHQSHDRTDNLTLSLSPCNLGICHEYSHLKSAEKYEYSAWAGKTILLLKKSAYVYVYSGCYVGSFQSFHTFFSPYSSLSLAPTLPTRSIRSG